MTQEQNLTLAQAARLAPNKPHVSTLWRWCRIGIKARNGHRITLEHWRYGGKIYTSPEAMKRFAKHLSEADAQHFNRDSDHPQVTPVKDTNDRHHASAIRKAEAQCKAAGI